MPIRAPRCLRSAAMVSIVTDAAFADPVFSVVGREDPYGFGMIEEKIPALTETLGEENVSIRVYDHLGHGFGLGTETVAKNWLQEAVDFWEAHR